MRLGIDLVEVQRFQKFLDRWGETGLLRLFTREEIAYARLANPELAAQRLAARFAAKEAFRKALGRSVPFREIEVVHGENGPYLLWQGRRFPVSLTHTTALAAAVVFMPSPDPSGAPGG